MKSRILYITGMAVLLLGIFHLFSVKEENYLPKETGITVIVPIASTGYWSRIADEITGVCENYQIDVKCVGFQEADAQKQAKAIRRAIWSGTKGIITAGIADTQEIREAFDEAEKQDIPIILIDSDLEESQRACYVGTDNYKAGKIAGEEMAKISGQSGKILMIVSDMDNRNQKERAEGFREVIDQYANMEIADVFEGNSNEVYIQDNVARIFEENPQITGIYCAEGYGAECVSRLKKDSPEIFGDIFIVGFDGDMECREYLKNGSLNVDIQQDTWTIGKQSAQTLVSLLTDSSFTASDVYTDVECIYPDSYKRIEAYYSGDTIWHIY